MGGRQSTPTGSTASPMERNSNGHHHSAPGSAALSGPSSSREGRNSRHLMAQSDWRQRARSLGNVMNGQPSDGHSLLNMPGMGLSFGLSGSPDSDTSTEDISVGHPGHFRFSSAHSLPVHVVPFNGIKCPVCSKNVLPDDVECHLVMCLTKPRISYNDDILTEDKDECVICLEDLLKGETIARLPCLCIYHKTCIDSWFEVNRSCPEHPAD